MTLAAIPPPPFDGFDLGFTEIRIYGILIATAVLVAATWTRRRYERMGGSGELADRVTIWAVVIAFIGSRTGYIIPRIDRFVDDPLSVFQIWEGGLALYGGLTFGLVTLFVLLRRWGGDFGAFMDALAPALPLAQAIGRWGNYFNQELFGTATDVPWALEVEVAGTDTSTVHPTFLYESLLNLVVVGVVLAVERRGRLRKGSLIWVYGIGYGLIRFAMELLRTDTTWRFLGLSRNGLVSIVLVLGSVVALRWLQSRPEPAPAVGADADEGDGGDEEGGDAEPGEASAVLVGVTDADDATPADEEPADDDDAEQR